MRWFPRRLILLVCALFTLVGTASAVEWLLVGARQRGMGGAGVATAAESSAIYWNPASLSAETNWSVGVDLINTSIELAPDTLPQLQNLVDTIEQIQTDFTDLQTSFDSLSAGSGATDDDLAKVLDLVLNHFSHLDRKDLGLLYDVGLNVNVQAGSFGVGVGVVGYFDMGLVADIQGLALAALGTATQNIDSAMYLGGTVNLGALPALTYPAEIADLGNTIETMMTDAGVANPNQATAVLLYIASYDPVTDPGLNPLESDPVLSALGIDSFGGADLTDPNVQSMLTNIVAATLGDNTLVEYNETGVHLRGAGIVEVAIAKSFPIMKDRLSIGAAVKMLTARTFNIDVNYSDYSQVTGTQDAFDDLMAEVQDQFVDNPLDSTQVAIDLGIDFKLNKFIRLGMTMKNLNRPEFDLPNTSDKFVLDPQVRFGAAFYPLSWLCVTTDVDLSENRSQIATDYGMRFYSLGVEATLVKVLQLRTGLYGNLLAPETTPAFTLGAGVKFGSIFKLDLAVNGDLQKLSSLAGGGSPQVEDLPARAGFSLSMQFHTKF